jgi:hypothetical protein
MRYAQDDRHGQNDAGNRLNSDATVPALQEHNARYRAAWPSGN